MTNETYEVALSEDGTVYGPFEVFVPGDVRLLDNFVKFRVTVFGDFAEEDYRLRGFSGIVDDATTSSGGFGVSPFGRFPFGDGGVCLDASGGDFDGSLLLSGVLEVGSPSISLSGSMSLTGSLSVVVSEDESGSLALSGSLATAATNPAAAALFAYGPTSSFTGTQNFSIADGMTTTTGLTTDQASFRTPIAINITSLYVILAANVPGGSTFTLKLVVNDVVQGGIIVTIPAGSRVGNASGLVTVSAHDRVCLQANVTPGAAIIQGVTAGYFSA